LINITDSTARTLYQQEFERNMAALENVQIRELKPVLNRQYMRAAQSVQQGMLDIDYAVDKDSGRLRTLLARHYRRIAAVFGEKVFKAIEESKKSLAVPEIKGPKDEFWTDLNRWMRTEATKKIRHVQDTTKRNIARTIRKGMEEGESHRTIAKRVRKTGRISTVRRAVTIARTETHTAAVKSVNSAVASTRIEFEREWVSARDDRTRSRIRKDRFEHYLKYPAGPDGEKVAQDGKFTKTGEALDYPGDPAGSAGNVIACRCVLLYKPVKRTERLKPYEPEAEQTEWMRERGVELEKGLLAKDAKEGVRQLGRIPSGVLTTVGEQKGKFRILKPYESITTQKEYATLKGKKPRGWISHTWDDACGCSNDVTMGAVVGRASGSISTIRHEMGHLIDKTVGQALKKPQARLIYDPEFDKTYKRLLELDAQGKIKLANYFKQPGAGWAGKQETLAGFMDCYYATSGDVVAAYKARRILVNNRWGGLGKGITSKDMKPMIDWWEGIVKELK